jgi:transposase
MKKSNKFSHEVRERAVGMVQEHRGDDPSLWAAIESMAPKIGCVPQTLHEWVKRVEVDTGVREGVTTSEAQRVKVLASVQS